LKEWLACFEKQVFGRKSEKTEVVMECSFFDEPDAHGIFGGYYTKSSGKTFLKKVFPDFL